MTPNDTANVTVARGVAGGYLLSAPTPTDVSGLIAELSDLSAPLPRGFDNLGYVSADGVTEAESVTTEPVLDVDGQQVDVTRTERAETVRFRLVEMRAAALAEAHGHANVTSGRTLLVAHHNNAQREHRTYVADLVLKDGRRWRKVVPDGQVTEVAELALASTQLVGRELTVACNSRRWELDGIPHRDTAVDFVEQHDPDAFDPIPGSARLARLLSNVALTPAFAPWVTEYSLVTHVRGLMLRAHALDPAAVISAELVDELRVDMRDGRDCYVDTYEEGEHTLEIAVTNPDSGDAGTYTLSIRYEPEDSGDARLAYVRMYGYTLEPMFDPDVHEYSTAIDSRWASVAFMPADSSATVRMSLNGGSPITGYPGTSHQLNWAEGDNTLVLTCTRGTQTTSYTLRVAYAS
jgi:hypothetical protein